MKYFERNAVLLNGYNLMKADIDMSNRRIYNLPNPTGAKQPATKSFVENKINDYLIRDGSQAMTGDLQMGKKVIEDLETPNDVPITDLVNYRKDAYRAANKEYLCQNFLKKDGDDYDLRQKIIKNCEPYYPDLFSDNDLVSKAFVDAEIAKLPKNVLKLDGSLPMTGNLQMGDNAITGIKSSSQDNAALTVGDAKSIYFPLSGSRAMRGNLQLGDNAITEIKSSSQDNSALTVGGAKSVYLPLSGNKKMEGKLDINLWDIINLPTADSNESSYAANVNYVNTKVSDNNATIDGLIDSKVAKVEALNIKASKRENVLSFVMDNDLFKEDDDDITKVGKVEKNFYDINQATYQFTIDYDSKIGYYSTRLTIDLKAFDIGEFTLVFEA